MAVLVGSPVPLIERFGAMGTQVEVQVIGGNHSVIHQAQARVSALETRWSRFRTGSDVSALNRNAGSSVPVAPETILLLERAVAGARATGGRFDPTVGAALLSHGYDRTFADVADAAQDLHPFPVVDGSWPMIEINAFASTASIPEGTVFDPGGIGKGLAADLVAAELADQADGILVNIGGDLRLCGTGPDPAGWIISIEDPFVPMRELACLALPEGAVATSSCMQRRWKTADAVVHHIIDPFTGTSARTGVASVTVVAAETWWAEIQATSLLLQGPGGLADLDDTVEALIVTDEGECHATPLLEAVLR